MGDPVTLALGAQAGSSIFGGLAGSAEAKGEKQRAEINAYIGHGPSSLTRMRASA